jgi:hypothetical protein
VTTVSDGPRHGVSHVQTDDPRVVKLGAILGVPADECFEFSPTDAADAHEAVTIDAEQPAPACRAPGNPPSEIDRLIRDGVTR